MKRCPRCKFENDALRKSCGSCGADIDGSGGGTSRAEQVGSTSQRAVSVLDGSDQHQVLSLLRSGQKIPAIKLYREVAGVGLKEAKEAVEEIARANGIQLKGSGSGVGFVVAVLLAIVIAGLVMLR